MGFTRIESDCVSGKAAYPTGVDAGAAAGWASACIRRRGRAPTPWSHGRERRLLLVAVVPRGAPRGATVAPASPEPDLRAARTRL